MLKKAIIAIAAGGFFAACAHQPEQKPVNDVQPPNEVKSPQAKSTGQSDYVAQDSNSTNTYGKPDPVLRPTSERPTAGSDGFDARVQARSERAQADAVAGSPTAAGAGSSTNTNTKSKVEPDNTAMNKRDQDNQTLTPMDQGNSGGDLKITQEIRKAIVGADRLSFSAKNVKIITRDANVTLRGPVKSASEKQRIDELARSTAGVARVDNQLEVESTN